MGDSAAPEALLAKLEPDREIAVGSVRGLGAALPMLVAAGWLEVRTQGRAQVARLTATGAAKRAQVLAAPPRARRRTEAPGNGTGSTTAITPAALAARLVELAAQVEALTARVAQLEGRAPAPVTVIDLAPAALAAIAELDASGRYGGLVPIPVVRGALRARGADDAAISATLLELERQFRIDLSIAQSPTTAPDRSQGIERPGRGLLYYVARR
ncbi:MAG: hypothetical protein K8W52_35220 [Deltaproteobacteria bacterium]|nr:hypothetical protein [Deltaproteobacteria bacterium]